MTAPIPSQVAADLRAAADVLEGRGWRQGDYVDSNGCRCVDGAIVWATGGDWTRLSVPTGARPRRDAAERALADHLGLLNTGTQPHFGIQGWNDTPGRTAAEVIAALRAAADRAEAQS